MLNLVVLASAELEPALVRAVGTISRYRVCPEPMPEAVGNEPGSPSARLADWFARHAIDAVVYAPPVGSEPSAVPDLVHAEAIFRACATGRVGHVVLLSSAAAYGATPHHPGFVRETRSTTPLSSPTAHAWVALERLAAQRLGSAIPLSILRPGVVLTRDRAGHLSRMLRGRAAVVLPGHDPTMQFVSPRDLGSAAAAVLQHRRTGLFNVAPRQPITLRAALRLARRRRLPVPYVAQRLVRKLLAPIGVAASVEELDYIRYPWTVSDEKLRRETEFKPADSSATAIAQFLAAGAQPEVAPRDADTEFDPFGMDRAYIDAYGRTLFRFLQRYYWRIEVDGAHHLPGSGRAVLVGVHRGFMPWDGVMAMHLIVQETGRVPRFLIHPGVGLKFPFLSNFMSKLGGVMACQENAAYVLERDEMLGVFPEGIRGAFTRYRDAYRLGRSWRDDFVRIALRHRAPIIPFVTVGSAEIFPILGRIDWAWWKRYTEWPYFPLTPTFPLLPLPLPSKWHTQFLAPIRVDRDWPAAAADDPAVIERIDADVRRRIEQAITTLVQRRRSIFFGSVFTKELGA